MESCRWWVPTAIWEYEGHVKVNPAWSCAADTRSAAWDLLISWMWNAKIEEVDRDAALRLLRKNGWRLLPATATLDPVEVRA